MPLATPALALIALANATTPDRPVWNVTPLMHTDHIPRARAAHVRPHTSLHATSACTLLRGQLDNAEHMLHSTPATLQRLGSWPVAYLSSSLDRVTIEGPAFMVQALTLLHHWCLSDKSRQQCSWWHCERRNWGPLWSSEPTEERAQPSRDTLATQYAYCTARLHNHANTCVSTILYAGLKMDMRQSARLGAGLH